MTEAEQFQTSNLTNLRNGFYQFPFTNLSQVVKIDNVAWHVSPNLVNFPAGIRKIFPNLFFIKLDRLGIKNLHQKDLKDFPQLIHLDLEYNDISVLEKDLFRFNKFLRTINFKINELKIIDRNIFDDLKYLQGLNLIDNRCVQSLYFGKAMISVAISTIRRECKPYERPNQELALNKEQKFKWRKIFWYFLILGIGLSLLAVYCLVRVFCVVKVGPDDEGKKDGCRN